MNESEDRLLAQAVYLQSVLKRRIVRLFLARRFRVAIQAAANHTEHRVRASASPLHRAPAIGDPVMVRFSKSTYERIGLHPGSVGTVVDHAPDPVAPHQTTVVVDWGNGLDPRVEDLFYLMYPPRTVPTW